MLVVDGLAKRYGRKYLAARGVPQDSGDRYALREVSFRVGRGICGVVGPNGAGKTTLFRLVAGILPPTAGRIEFDGIDALRHPVRLRGVLGYLPQEFGVYPEMTAVCFLSYMGMLKGLPPEVARRQAGAALEMAGLDPDAREPLGTCSAGVRRRVGLAQALLADPRLLVLDEPFTGVDLVERRRLLNVLSDLAADRAILLSTHVISDLEGAAERLVILHHGRTVFDGFSAELLAAAGGHVWQVTAERPVEGAVPASPTLEDA